MRGGSKPAQSHRPEGSVGAAVEEPGRPSYGAATMTDGARTEQPHGAGCWQSRRHDVITTAGCGRASRPAWEAPRAHADTREQPDVCGAAGGARGEAGRHRRVSARGGMERSRAGQRQGRPTAARQHLARGDEERQTRQSCSCRLGRHVRVEGGSGNRRECTLEVAGALVESTGEARTRRRGCGDGSRTGRLAGAEQQLARTGGA
uniref:Predicted protein n=1 Tax=Hordeum vulgare subsp. vulgare TaxID=112509 RepID=F2ELL5_HORVV|nr:predicted protein [Hordeum vulgare subsp. vulgare]